MKKSLTTFATLALVVSPLVVSAQSNPTPAPAVAPGAQENLGASIADCSSYYTFGSVHANLSAQVTNTTSGIPITFAGTLENTNPYPIVDGALYVKIFRARKVSDSNGPDVVDQFLVKDEIAIPAHGSVPISFQWKIPSFAVSGDYSLATFFTTSHKFNLLGLSFTDDVVGNTIPFKVSGEQTSSVAFDKSSVTVNGGAYHFASFPPRISGTAPVTVSAVVKNTTDNSASASLNWEIYQWDAQLRINVVQEQTSAVVVPAHSSKTVSITVTDAKYPVYLAVGTLKWQDEESVIGVRYVRDGVDRTRINFPGVTSFPLKAGESNTLFSCLHNAGQSAVVANGRLVLTLSDMSGNVIHTFTYTGDVTSSMMGVADKFTPSQNYDKFTLDANLYQGDQFVDSAHLVYDCAAISPDLCTKTGTSNGILGSLGGMISALFFGLVALLVGVWLWKWARRLPPPPPIAAPK